MKAKVVRVKGAVEKRLFEFVNQDRICNFWTIYDLTHLRDKTRTWAAVLEDNIIGYLLEHDKRILQTRGEASYIVPLLRSSDLATPIFNIEPAHLVSVKKLYKPTEPTDPASKGKITTYLCMIADAYTFRPALRHHVQAVKRKDWTAVSNLLSREPDRIVELVKGPAYGLYEGNRLVSFAASPESLDDLAIVRGVYTTAELRGRGYAASVCSALVAGLLQHGKEALLYVSKDNKPAIKLYTKLGFRETGHVFQSFKAEKRA